MKNIILMGFMGAGKTTIGEMLAKTLKYEFIDTDEWIEREQGKKIGDIFAEDGETAFRDMETKLLKDLLYYEKQFVLSIGGGMPLREENRKLLCRLGTVIYLKTSKEEIVKRVYGDKKRPLLQGGSLEETVSALMNAREAVYLEAAHKEIVTDAKTPQEIVNELI